LRLTLRATVHRGDEVILAATPYALFPPLVTEFGARIVFAGNRGEPADLDALLSAVTPKTRAVLFSNPHNPFGSYHSATALRAFRERLPAHIVLLVDGALAEYAGANPQEGHPTSLLRYSNVVITGTFSKLYGLASIRVAWAASSTSLAPHLAKYGSRFPLPVFAERAAIAALHDREHAIKRLRAKRSGRNFLREQLQDLGLPVWRSSAPFVLCDLPNDVIAMRIHTQLTKLGVRSLPLHDYGLPTKLRIKVGHVGQLNQAVIALRQILGS